MTRIFIAVVLLVSLAACAESTRDSSKKNISQHERDSILAESALPGAKTVGKAIAVSDSSAARAKRVDEQSD